MKYKLISSDYNEETKETKVIIQTKEGHFTGSTISQEGSYGFSIFLGGEIAELKALRKAYGCKRRKAFSKLNTLMEIDNALKEEGNVNYLITVKIREVANAIGKYDEEISKLTKRIIFLSDEGPEEVMRNKTRLLKIHTRKNKADKED